MSEGVAVEPFIRGVKIRRGDFPEEGGYPFDLRAVRNLDRLPLHPKVTFFVGENGSGKSTLIEAIAVAAGFNAEGGTKSFDFCTDDSVSVLSDYVTLERKERREKQGFFLRAESFYNVATEVNELDRENQGYVAVPLTASYGGRSLHNWSHGESFITLLTTRMSPVGLYILDEPESALSPIRQLSFLKVLHERVSEGSQFIIATHSPIIMAYPDSVIYSLDGDAPTPVNYEDLEHVQVTRDFLQAPEAFLDELLRDS